MKRSTFIRGSLTLLIAWGLAVPTQASHHTAAALGRTTHYPLDRLSTGETGPWGQLSLTTLILQPSPDSFPASRLTSQTPRWHFARRTVGELEVTLQQAGLNAEQVAQLMATHSTTGGDTTLVLYPPEQMLLGLETGTRSRIYALMAHGNDSQLYQYPLHFPAEYESAWYRKAPLGEDTLALLDRLVYPRGEMLYFSDLRFLYSKINSASERRHLAATLLRQPTLLVRVTVTTAAEAEAAIAYWGQGRRDDQVRPLLEALSRADVNQGVDLAQLLPPLARMNLYTYQHDKSEKFLDCRWTALNFLADEPDDRFLQDAEIFRTLQEDYVSVLEHFALGDVILLRNRDGQIIHMCNYVADNIVFTKNGGDLSQPWMLSTLHDVINFYTINGDTPAYLVLRRKD